MGLIQMLGKVDATLMSFEIAEPPNGMTHAEMAAHSLDFWLQTEDLPDPANRITVNREGAIELHYKENNIEAYNRLVDQLRSLLGPIGCTEHLIPVEYYLGTKFPLQPGPSGRDDALRHRPGQQRVGCKLQTTRSRQCVCDRCGVHAVHRRRESVADHHR